MRPGPRLSRSGGGRAFAFAWCAFGVGVGVGLSFAFVRSRYRRCRRRRRRRCTRVRRPFRLRFRRSASRTGRRYIRRYVPLPLLLFAFPFISEPTVPPSCRRDSHPRGRGIRARARTGRCGVPSLQQLWLWPPRRRPHNHHFCQIPFRSRRRCRCTRRTCGGRFRGLMVFGM